MPSIDLAALRRAVQEDRYLITTHAMQRMGYRKVSHDDIKQVIANGDVIEEYPDNKPDPKILVMAHVREEPLYVSCAFNGRYAYIVTVHWYDPTRWIDPWTRK
jgi:hypothetical protein